MGIIPLLKTRRFAPLFLVQFLAAFNDNVFKNGMVMLVAFRAVTEAESAILSNMAAFVFILPFFLASAAAGQICDKYEKAKLVLWVKVAGVFIMGLGAVGLVTGSVPILFAALLLAGIDSTLFGPIKYSILPQHLKGSELITANALVEGATFCAILLGLVAGGLLYALGIHAVAIACVVVSLITLAVALFVPQAPAADPDLEIKWNPFTETLALARLARRDASVFTSIVLISWFWFFGATSLAQFPGFVKFYLGGSESALTLMMAVYSLAVGIGSIVAGYLSRGELELGMVPLSALGISIFALDFSLITYPVLPAELLTAGQLLSGQHGWFIYRVLFDSFVMGFLGGCFTLPLYTMMQIRSEERYRSRIIAANNVINSVYMVVSAIVTMILMKFSMTIIGIFAVLSVFNAMVIIYAVKTCPELMARTVFWLRFALGKPPAFVGREHIPPTGPALLVAKTKAPFDSFVLTAAAKRMVLPLNRTETHWVARILARLIPALTTKGCQLDQGLLNQAFKGGQLVAFFLAPDPAPQHEGILATALELASRSAIPVVPCVFARDPAGRVMVHCFAPTTKVGDKGEWQAFMARTEASLGVIGA